MTEKLPPSKALGLLSLLDDETRRHFDQIHRESERRLAELRAIVPAGATLTALARFQSTMPVSEAALALERNLKRFQAEARPDPFGSILEQLDELERLQVSKAKAQAEAKARAAAEQEKKRAAIERRAETLRRRTAEKHRELDELICAAKKRGDDFRGLRKAWEIDYGLSQAALTLRIQALRKKDFCL